MSYVAVNKDGRESVFNNKPKREYSTVWEGCYYTHSVILPKGSIEKLIGRKLTWEDEPVELRDEK